MQKNQKNLMAGSMRTFVTETDGQTDGADYIGPEAGPTSKLEVDPLRRKEKKSRTN